MELKLWPRARPDQLPRGLASLCAFLFTRLEAHLNLPLPACHLEISVMSELRADVPVGGCCLLSAPLAPATL